MARTQVGLLFAAYQQVVHVYGARSVEAKGWRVAVHAAVQSALRFN